MGLQTKWAVEEVASLPESETCSIKFTIARNGNQTYADIRRFLSKASLHVFLKKQGFRFDREGLDEFIRACQELRERLDDSF